MPPIRRRAKARNDWAELEIDQLRTDWEFIYLSGFGNDFRGDLRVEEYRACWEDMGEEVLRQWLVEHPLSRPSAWWRFSAPEPRRWVGAGPMPTPHPSQPDRLLWVPYGSMPRRNDGWEPEVDYLTRLDLLTPEESAALASRAAPTT